LGPWNALDAPGLPNALAQVGLFPRTLLLPVLCSAAYAAAIAGYRRFPNAGILTAMKERIGV
jgi:hypothetical protein